MLPWTTIWILIVLHSRLSMLKQEPLYTALFLMFSLLMFLLGWKTGAGNSRSPVRCWGQLWPLWELFPVISCACSLLYCFLSRNGSRHLLDFHFTQPFPTSGNWQMKEGLLWNPSFGREFFKFADKLSAWILSLPQKEKLTVIANLQPARTIVFEAQCWFFPLPEII